MPKPIFAAVLLLFSLAQITTAHADAPLLTTFNDAAVWHSANADASGATESVIIDPATNLLLSSTKPSDWGFAPKDPVADSISITGGGVRTQVGKSDGVDYHYQVGQGKIALVEGKTYVLSFRAKADAARSISVSAQAVGGDWHMVGLGQALPLMTEWQPSKITFVAKNVTGNTQLVFNIGQQNGVVWLADMTLIQVPDASAAPETATALKINVVTKGGLYDVQTLSKPLDITNGQAYLLTFKARADAPRTATMVVRINAPDWHAVSDFDPSISLGTSWHTYSLPFTASNAGPGNNVVALSLGDQAGMTWVADLTLTHTGAGVVQKSELPVIPPAPIVPIPANAYRILFAGNSTALQSICAKRTFPFVSVASIAADPSCHGTGTDPDARRHPNDRGPAKYADLIFTTIRPLLTRSNTAQSQTHVSATNLKAQS